MHPQLTRLAGEYEAALARLRALAARVPPEAWPRRPAPHRWAVADCVAHLNLTSAAFAPLLRQALAEARALGGPVPARYRRDPWGWLVAAMAGPTRWIRVRTPPPFVPTADQPADRLVAEFERWQADHLACLGEADGLPLDRVQVVSPFDGRVRYSLYSAFAIIPGHQQRHLAQAEQAASGR